MLLHIPSVGLGHRGTGIFPGNHHENEPMEDAVGYLGP